MLGTTKNKVKFLFSVISHGQMEMIKSLLLDFKKIELSNCAIILTINIQEDLTSLDEFTDLPIHVLKNKTSKGFGANHNYAFGYMESEFFVIVNPDIRLNNINMNNVLDIFRTENIGAVAPQVISPNGFVEDSARYFPTVPKILNRIKSKRKILDYSYTDAPIYIDWAAGMFVVYRSIAFSNLSGFDERYFMYYEDADICYRLKKIGFLTVLHPRCIVVHDAQRKSHRNLRYFFWHISSLFRILFLPSKKS